MNLENIIEDWMGFLLVFLRKPISWISLLAPPFLRLLGAGFLQIFLTSAALLLSSFFFICTSPKQNHRLVVSVNEVQQPAEQEINATRSPVQAGKDDELSLVILMKRSLVSFSDESSEFSQEQSSITEDSEFGETASSDISDDGTISDEESLIELSLPGGHYVCDYNKEQDFMKQGNKNKQHPCDLHKINIQDCRFNDMFEEDNLIEIDISMGSIKYSRLEIKA